MVNIHLYTYMTRNMNLEKNHFEIAADRRMETLERHMAQVMEEMGKIRNLLAMKGNADLPIQELTSPYKRLRQSAVSVGRPTTVAVEPVRS